MINSVAVLKTSADVAGIAMEVHEGRHAASFLLGMTDEVRVEGNFVAGFYVNDLKRQRVDFGRGNARPMWTDVGVEEKIVLNRVEDA